MELQDGGGDARGHGAGEGVAHNLSLCGAVGHEKQLAGAHDGADAHGAGVGGNLVDGVEQATVSLAGHLGELDAVSLLLEDVIGLVEADVAVVADAEELDVNAAGLLDSAVVGVDAVLDVEGLGVGGVSLGHIDVHVVKEVLLHEVAVALGMGALQAAIFVEVERLALGEAEVACLIALHQVGVQADGGGARCQAQDTVRLGLDDGGDLVGGQSAHLFIRVGNDQLHAICLSSAIPVV